ncbi:unnamed protein product [Polarella glacialis]|uniref:Uncharacterized protein n=1 Tax=Polarella glacialis TaxID=89957 RepID=A0A813KKP1_POLGL|nr:unnamed protein product [Polarella glacialis]
MTTTGSSSIFPLSARRVPPLRLLRGDEFWVFAQILSRVLSWWGVEAGQPSGRRTRRRILCCYSFDSCSSLHLFENWTIAEMCRLRCLEGSTVQFFKVLFPTLHFTVVQP